MSNAAIIRYRALSSPVSQVDYVATEEPLEIRILHRVKDELLTERLAVTMRTPGNDFELAAGFLFSEGVVRSREDISSISYCTDVREPQKFNIVNVLLREDVVFDPESLSRHVFTSSACGVCGSAVIEQLQKVHAERPVGDFRIDAEFLTSLHGKIKALQSIFAKTGGLHACVLVSPDRGLGPVAEDVGRHNAMDKLVGRLLLNGRLPASNRIVFVTGRAGFELVQKAVLAGVPMIVAVGAPTSLAVSVAQEYGVTLVGFLSDRGFNVYSGKERVVLHAAD